MEAVFDREKFLSGSSSLAEAVSEWKQFLSGGSICVGTVFWVEALSSGTSFESKRHSIGSSFFFAQLEIKTPYVRQPHAWMERARFDREGGLEKLPGNTPLRPKRRDRKSF